jgi:hypothetical protein
MTRDVIIASHTTSTTVTWTRQRQRVHYDGCSKNREHGDRGEYLLRSDYRAIRVYGSLEYSTQPDWRAFKVDYDNTSMPRCTGGPSLRAHRVINAPTHLARDVWWQVRGRRSTWWRHDRRDSKDVVAAKPSDKLELELKHVQRRFSRSRKADGSTASPRPSPLPSPPARPLPQALPCPRYCITTKAALQR